MIGVRAEKCIALWKSQKYHFCWAELLFGVFGLLHRKIYRFAFYTLLMAFVLLSLVFAIPFEYFVGVGVLMLITLSILGHSFYQSSVTEMVAKVQQNPKDGMDIFRLSGGVTWSMPLASLVLQILVVLFLVLETIQFIYFS